MTKNGVGTTIITLVLVALALLSAALLSLLGGGAEPGPSAPVSIPETLEQNSRAEGDVVAEGRLPGYEDYDINTDADAFYYLIGSSITFNKPQAAGPMMIENTPGNVCDMQVEITLEDGGRQVYLSPVLSPGFHIEKDCLDVVLEKGEYPAIATITALDAETGESKATFTERITLIIKKKFF